MAHPGQRPVPVGPPPPSIEQQRQQMTTFLNAMTQSGNNIHGMSDTPHSTHTQASHCARLSLSLLVTIWRLISLPPLLLCGGLLCCLSGTFMISAT